MRGIKALADEVGAKTHLDGARLLNAALALGVEPAEITAHVDSVMFCLSKGLGAPVGSLLAGDAQFIEKARRCRKMLGGGMRQVGVLAAPGILALTEGRACLAADHENARLLAIGLSNIPGVALDLASVQTNMVWIKIDSPGKSCDGLVRFLGERGIHTYPPMHRSVRFVTSSRVDAEDVGVAIKTVGEYLIR
jgi:threonine aldolase